MATIIKREREGFLGIWRENKAKQQMNALPRLR